MYFDFMNVCMSASMCTIRAGALEGQKRVSESLELKLKEAVSCLMWVLGTESWSSTRARMLFTADVSLQHPLETFLLSQLEECQ